MKSTWSKLAGASVVVAFAVILGLALAAGFFDRDPVSLIGKFGGERRRIAVLFFSGDMGVRFGAGPHVTKAFAASGIPVVSVSSPALFATRRTREQVDRIVADSIETALATSKADRLVVIGQSYGSDILGTGLAALDPALRSRIAAVVLVVPGEKVFFRADPTDLTYQGKPDALAVEALARIDWVRVVEATDTEFLFALPFGAEPRIRDFTERAKFILRLQGRQDSEAPPACATRRPV